MAIGPIIALAVASIAYLNRPGPYYDFKATLQCHMVFDSQKSLWIVESFLTVPNQPPSGKEQAKAVVEMQKTLRSQGWLVNPDRGNGISCYKASPCPENASRWRLSRTERVELVDVPMSVDDHSFVDVDAPKGMVLETFPRFAKVDPLVSSSGDLVRTHVPLQYAVGEKPYLNLKTTAVTIWARIIAELIWLGTKGIVWLILAVLAAIGTLLRDKIKDWIDRLFKKKKPQPGITKKDIPKGTDSPRGPK